jgi:hypothetical protein
MTKTLVDAGWLAWVGICLPLRFRRNGSAVTGFLLPLG